LITKGNPNWLDLYPISNRENQNKQA
jgi:hypothetical protein